MCVVCVARVSVSVIRYEINMSLPMVLHAENCDQRLPEKK